MKKRTKIILAVSIGVSVIAITFISVVGVALYMGGKYIKEGISQDPQRVEAVAKKIVDFKMPEGYKPAVSTDLFGTQTVFYSKSSKDGSTQIMLLQLSKEFMNGSEEQKKQFEKSFDQQLEQRGLSKDGTAPVSEKEIIINGKPVKLVQYLYHPEKNAKHQFTTRNYMAKFEGKNGFATLQIFGNDEGFDEEGINSFIDSLK